jgi:hypothetical protein
MAGAGQGIAGAPVSVWLAPVRVSGLRRAGMAGAGQGIVGAGVGVCRARSVSRRLAARPPVLAARADPVKE